MTKPDTPEHEHKPCPVCRICLRCHPHTQHERDKLPKDPK